MHQAETKISAVVITFNEAPNMKRCLDSLLAVADEIIVVDSFSDDATPAICKNYPVLFFQRKFRGYSDQKNWGIAQARYNYILSLDADEVLSEELIRSILQEKKAFSSQAYLMARKNFIGRKWLRWGGWYPDKKIRLFHKKYARWNDRIIHESVTTEPGTIPGHLKGDLLHFSFSSLADHLITIKKYSRLRVRKALEAGKSYHFAGSLCRAFFKFFQLYFLKLGFLDGCPGYRCAINGALRHLIVFATYRKTGFPKAPRQKVVLFNTTETWGGGEKWHFEAALRLKEAGRPVALVARKNSPLATKAAEKGIETHVFGSTKISHLNPFAVGKLMRLFRDKQWDTVLFNGSVDLKTGGLAAYFAGVPHIIYRRGLASPPSGSHLNVFLFSVVVTYFIANSKSTLELLALKTRLPLSKIHASVVYNGVNHTAPESPPPFSAPSDKLIIGNASRLVTQKGLHHLIRIGAVLQQKKVPFEIRIAGSGPLEDALKAQAQKNGVADCVHFLGFVSDIPAFLHSINVYACTSEFEGFGFSMAEAMLCEKPVVAFDTSSNAEVVMDQRTGYIVPPYVTEIFAEKLLQLHADVALRSRMGKQGKAHVLKNFNATEQMNKVRTLLTRLHRED